MKLYYAGVHARQFEGVLEALGYKDILLSYFFIKGTTTALKVAHVKELQDKGYKIFMDSGGFSARVSGADIELDEYKDFLAGASKHCDVSANLDFGTWEEQEEKYEILKSTPGVVRVLPVYHIDEWETSMFKELDELLEKHDHIAIGGLAGENVTEEMKRKYLNFVFSRWNVFRKKGKQIKIHGFGITTQDYCFQYPFYSVDSTSWLGGARFGTFVVWDEKTHRFIQMHHTDTDKITAAWSKLPPNLRDFTKLSEKYAPPGTKSVYLNRIAVAAYAYEKFRESVTNAWASRGITW